MRYWMLLMVLWLSACSTPGIEQRDGYQVDTRHAALGARPRIKVLVLHYTAEDFPRSLATLTDREVSVHYLIPDRPPLKQGEPLIWQLVPESQLAWHAGISFWRGATRINDTSIGIELVNAGWQRHLTGPVWTPFTAQQIAVLQPLMRDIVQRYQIPAENIVGHSDIAPQRKQDPGPLFPWAMLAQQGLGAWPDAARVHFWLNGRDAQQPVPVDKLLGLLARYGYQVTEGMSEQQQQRVIAAFQMHFRQTDYRGLADAETEAIAQALIEKYPRD
ncbi:N-acetylmuramoyl-L-alanine amidase [Erwinia toletana]|uniref:N-acetylmuramoyl-L-alanine amidase n=1 Tax=Winslowiella toletana TaxID=92490 RepID=A0ABS4PD56_9GAMM|nr:N-acetylmuramoyl-L-alanine amidase [Winslowiella toletana]MBP2170586.1 N-acetylmuramoyl-L-alanine amidase [Winslowiella toletana]